MPKNNNTSVRGRPRKLTPQKIELALMLRDKGFSLKEIAIAIGIDESVLYFKGTEWEVLRGQLNAIKARKEQAKINKVSAALYDRAIGQKITNKKETLTKDGQVIELKEVKELPGDVKAQQFYLVNRDPENWQLQPTERDELEGKEDKTIKIEIVGD